MRNRTAGYVLLALLLSAMLVACGAKPEPVDNSSSKEDATPTSTHVVGSLFMEYPSTYTSEVRGKTVTVFPGFGGSISVQQDELSDDSPEPSVLYEEYLDETARDESYRVDRESTKALDTGTAAVGYRTSVTHTADDGTYHGFVEMIVSGNDRYNVVALIPDSTAADSIDSLEDMLDSIVIEGA